MILVQLGEGGFQSEITPGDLKFLNQVGGSGEQDPPAILHQGVADGGRQVRLAAAGRNDGILPDTRGRTRPSTVLFTRATASG